MIKTIVKCVGLMGLVATLASCVDPYYPPVTVTNREYVPAAASMHYGPPASSSMHYGPPRPYYPPVTVTGGGDAASSMHYGN